MIDDADRAERVELRDGTAVYVRVGEDDQRVTVTAWDVDGSLVGLSWCATEPSEHPREAAVEVTPTHRRRGIGSTLLRHLLAEASVRGVPAFTWTHPADDLAVRHLTSASAAVCARRVDHGRAKSTIFVPAA